MWTTHWPDVTNMTGEVNRLRKEMDRLFRADAPTNGGTARTAGFPALNVREDDDHLYVEAEIPGMELASMEIFVNGGDQLTVQGQRQRPEVEKGRWHRQERGFGKFARMVQLPNRVDAERVTAELNQGVLLIKMPKLEADKPRRIQVKTGA